MQFLNTVIFISLFFINTVLSLDIDSQENIAVYWGQNSQGGQQRLANYCQSSDADIFILSFLDIFPTNVVLNFANACSETFADNTNLLHCTQIASDIQTCQSLGKKVLLSLGGASGAYGFTTTQQAETFAQTLWDTFGEGENSSTVDRPFESVLVDGFDFDIENNINIGYAALVNKLRDLFKEGSKSYYISAAPQCPYPDASVGDLLANAQVDFAFIQFYNNYCNVDKQFNWADWENYAANVSPNKDIKLFLGLPGSPSAASSGFVSDLTLLQDTVNDIKTNNNFGGVAIWDASQGYSYQIDGISYIENVKNVLKNADSAAISSQRTTSTLNPVTTSTTSATSTTSVTSSTVIVEHATSTLYPVSGTTEASISNKSAIVMNIISATSTSSTISSSVIIAEHVTSTLYPASETTEASILTKSAVIMNTIPATSFKHHTDAKATTTLTPVIIVDKDVATVTSTTPSTTAVLPNTATPTAPTAPAAPAAPVTTTTTTSTDVATADTSAVSSVHVQTQQLNQLYSQGKFNGQDKCTDGQIACSSNGDIAICNFGSWVTLECADGTTCYAFDQDGQIFTQCGFNNLKSNFI